MSGEEEVSVEEVNPFENGNGEESGGIVDVLKRLATGSKVLSNNRNPKAYALVFAKADWLDKYRGKGSGDFRRKFAKDLLDLECGLAGKSNRARLIADASKALLQQENEVERRAGGAFG